MATAPKNILTLLEQFMINEDTQGRGGIRIPMKECRMLIQAIGEARDEVQKLHSSFQRDSADTLNPQRR